MAKIAVILVLPIEYNTSSMLRCRSIIEALVELGHDVKCYCPNVDVNSRYYSDEKINILNMQIFRFGKGNSIKQEPVNHNDKISLRQIIISILLKIVRKVDVFGSTLKYLPERKNISNDIKGGGFDILLSFSDPMPAHMIAKYCKKHNKRLRYVQQWGDPLAADTISKIGQPVWFRKIVEESLLRPADKICYVSPFTCDEQKALFPKQSNKMIFLPTPSLEYNEVSEKDEKFSIGYFGSYNSVARNLVPFYEAAKNIPDAQFYIIGDSDIVLNEQENIVVKSRVSPKELETYMSQIDVIVCLMNVKGNQIPGKLYHDASSTKDIMLIKDGEYGSQIEEFFSKYEHYTFVDNNVEDIQNAILNYIQNGVPKREPVEAFKAINVAKALIE